MLASTVTYLLPVVAVILGALAWPNPSPSNLPPDPIVLVGVALTRKVRQGARPSLTKTTLLGQGPARVLAALRAAPAAQLRLIARTCTRLIVDAVAERRRGHWAKHRVGVVFQDAATGENLLVGHEQPLRAEAALVAARHRARDPCHRRLMPHGVAGLDVSRVDPLFEWIHVPDGLVADLQPVAPMFASNVGPGAVGVEGEIPGIEFRACTKAEAPSDADVPGSDDAWHDLTPRIRWIGCNSPLAAA